MVAPLWNPCSHSFRSPWHHFFEHRFHIDCVMGFGISFDVCSLPFPFAHANCKSFKTQFCYHDVAWFDTSVIMFFITFKICVNYLFLVWMFDDFGYRIRLHLGTCFVFLPFVFRDYLFMIFWTIWLLTRKWTPKHAAQIWPHPASLPDFSAHLWVLQM